MSLGSCLSIFISQDPLQYPARIHVLASTNMDPLQDPRFRTHVSASSYLRILCKIHDSGSMCPIHVFASTNMDPLQDPRLDSCLIIFVSHGFSAASMSPDSCLCIFIAQDRLQDPCLPFMSASTNMDPLQDPCLRISISAFSYLRILCKIHVSGSMCPIHVLASTNMDPLQDPCLRAHVSASLYLTDSLQDPCRRIHVSASICISGSSARSMSPIHVLASTNMDPLRDPCLRIHVSASLYLRILCKIHVSGSMSQHPYVSQDPLQDPCLRIHVSASIFISGSSARSMSPDPCLRFKSQHPVIPIRCVIHVSVIISRHPDVWILSKIRMSVSIPVDPVQNRHGATARATRHAPIPQRVAWM